MAVTTYKPECFKCICFESTAKECIKFRSRNQLVNEEIFRNIKLWICATLTEILCVVSQPLSFVSSFRRSTLLKMFRRTLRQMLQIYSKTSKKGNLANFCK